MKPAELDYRGSCGITQHCLNALSEVLQNERGRGTAYLLSGPADRYGCRSHMFLLVPETGTRTLVSAGFASGYGGEGPRGLAQAILLLDSRRWDVNEIRVSQRDFNCLVDRSVTDEALERVLS